MARELLSYEDALEAMRGMAIGPRGVEEVSVAEAFGRVLAGEVVAKEPYPFFDNSAVDGYAVGSKEDAESGRALEERGSAHAGDPPPERIAPGTALRVLTGAALPEHVYGIAMQEDVEHASGRIVLKQEVPAGAHIRRVGDDFDTGADLLDRGECLGAGGLAVLAGQGQDVVSVYARPRIGVLATGDELVDPGQTPGAGAIRDSNGPMLAALAQEDGGRIVKVARVGDTYEETRRAIVELSEICDVVLCAGGASVGDRDFVPRIAEDEGEVTLHGARIRPGRPVLVGTIGRCAFFGLPGNPGSAFVTYLLFAREAIRRASGAARPVPAWVPVVHFGDARESWRDEFKRCRWVERDGTLGTVPVGAQGSFGVRSIAGADCLVRFPAGEAASVGTLQPTLPLRLFRR